MTHHVVLKADIRESTTLTRTLFERGLNPASYFSLNFYDPINKLLPKYDARKVFIEGDAIILALFEREGEPGLGVAQACVLAKEIIQVVTAYNERSLVAGLPSLELGHRHFLSGFRAHVPDGRHPANHDFQSYQ